MACLESGPYDVVVLLFDDLRADQLPLLTETLARLEPMAVQFDRAYVTTPLCAPSRASLLSGGYYAHQTGVLTNVPPLGGAARFPDTHTLATRLQEGGYTTALVGKYLNDYESMDAYVPPGWTVWAATVGEQPWTDYDVVEGSSTADAASTGSLEHHTRYLSTWQGDRAQRALTEHADAPVFLLLSFLAPHDPHTPAVDDAGSMAGYTWRGGAWEEADVSDKPAWLQEIPLLTEDQLASSDAVVQQRQESLLAADRAAADLIDAVEAAGRGDRTVFVLSSDNGMHWREHRLDFKGVAYEESARVPLLVAHPDLSPGSSDALVAMNLDLPATVAALAGLTPEGEGLSLISAVCSGEDTGREAVLLQSWTGDSPLWSGLVTADEKYVETDGGAREYYDLVADPSEERSLHEDAELAARVSELSETLAGLRGLSLADTTLPEATVGEPYAATLTSWGGTPPLAWSVVGGDLPAGLTLEEDGQIRGTPTEAGVVTLRIGVSDASASPLHGGPQEASEAVTLTVNAGELAEETGRTTEKGGCGCATDGGGVGGLALLVALALVVIRRG